MIVKVQGCKSDFILSFTVHPGDVEPPHGSRVPAVPLAVSRSAHLPRADGLLMDGTGAAEALPGRCSVLTALSCSETRGAALQALVSPARCRWPCGCEATGPCSPTGCNPTLNHAFCRTPSDHLRCHARRPGLLDAPAVLRSHAVFWRPTFSGAAQPAASR